MADNQYTELEKAKLEIEASNRETELKYKNLFQNMNEAVAFHQVIYDEKNKPVDYIILNINPAYEKLTGILKADAEGKLASILYKTGYPPFLDIFAEVAQTGIPVVREIFFPPMNKHFRVSICSTEKGKFATLTTDITSQKIFEKDLLMQSEKIKDSEAKLAYTAEISKLGYWRRDINTKELLWSDELYRIFGYEPGEIQPNLDLFLSFIYPDDLDNVLKNIKKVEQEKRLIKFEYRAHRKDNRIVICYALNDVILDNDGNITGYRGVLQDITEIRKAEEERRKFEIQVQQTQKLESLGVLAGGIAHDFNNLLMGILGNADLALNEVSTSSPICDYLTNIETASRKAADLCRQMLAYSGKGKFVIEHINLSEIIKEMVHMLEVSISKKSFMKFNLNEDIPDIEADASQIRQVIMNLVINASEAIGDKSGVITIKTGIMHCDKHYMLDTYLYENIPEGEYVFLEVSDNGCGMDEVTKKKLFEPFFSTKFTGRGLGMAAVLGIIRGHKGAIKVYTEPGFGSSFKILFPADKDYPSAVKHHGDEKWDIFSGNIMLIDDELMVLKVGKKMLERLGFNVITAENGKVALELFKDMKDKIVCIILDLTMPHLDGEGTFRELRRIKEDVVIILSSGYTEQEVTTRFSGKCISGFIQKPYQIKILKEKLKHALVKK